MADLRGKVIAAATDGACSGNPGPGGWGALIRFEDGSVKEFGGFQPATTNNRMELQAAIELLKELKKLPLHQDLTIRTDSKYLIDGLGKWMPGWKMKGWRTASGKPVLNQDLWKALDLAQIKDVPLSYVKAHSGDPDNERVDEIAVGFSKGLQPKLQSGISSIDKKPISTEKLPTLTKNNERIGSNLQELLSKLELADRFAERGYGLNLVEISQLVEIPIEELEKKKTPWSWRDWVIEPLTKKRWRLRRSKENHYKPEGMPDD